MRTPKRSCIFLFILCYSIQYNANGQVSMKVGKNEPIRYSNPLLPIVEPHLAVDPKNGDHMVIGAIVFDSAQTSSERTHIVVFATKDNGKTWKQTDLPMKVGFDPWVAIRNEKQVGLVALAGYTLSYRNGLVYFFSEDGGFTWLEKDTVMFGGGHDHATMTIDVSQKRLYVLSSLTKRDSLKKMHTYAWLNHTDDWKTFEKNASLFHIGEVNSNTLTLNTGINNGLVLPFVEYSVNNEQPGAPVYKYVYNVGGSQFSGPFTITKKAGLAKGFAVTALGQSGKYKGRIYFVKNTGTDPRRSNGLFMQYSDSIGGNWSEDIRVDHDEASEKFIRTAAIAVNKHGVVGIAWVDRRNDPELKKNDIYFTVSLDGGQTFLKETRVTGVSADPATAQNGKAGERFISGGDYIGCAAKPDGSFQLVWADSRTGVFQLYTSTIVVNKK